MMGDCWKNLQHGFFRGGGSHTAFTNQELPDLPGRADSKVAKHLFDRRVHPSSKEGKVDSRPIFLRGKRS